MPNGTGAPLGMIALTAAIFLGIFLLFPRPGDAWALFEGKPDAEKSRAAFAKIATVLQHPRCLNCHQAEVPLQGDERRVHIPRVVRGADDMGVAGMRCANCHNDSGNNPTAGVPGAPHWRLAPKSMIWQGLSVGDLCRMLKDKARNGGRSLEAIVAHMDTEPLVLWGWDPGAGRSLPPIAHREFVQLMKDWVSGGAACPA